MTKMTININDQVKMYHRGAWRQRQNAESGMPSVQGDVLQGEQIRKGCRVMWSQQGGV